MRILVFVTSNPPAAARATSNRFERVLAFAIAGIVVLSLVCFFAVVIGTAAGAGADDGFSRGAWPAVFLVPYIGLPLAFLLIVVVLVLSGIRRRRAATGGDR